MFLDHGTLFLAGGQRVVAIAKDWEDSEPLVDRTLLPISRLPYKLGEPTLAKLFGNWDTLFGNGSYMFIHVYTIYSW